MYLGFSQIPLAIGWTLEGKLGPWLYDHYASKDRIAREVLGTNGLSADAVAAIPQGEAFDKLVTSLGQDKWDVTAQLYATHDVAMVWYIMGVVGIISAIGIYVYGRWIRTLVLR